MLHRLRQSPVALSGMCLIDVDAVLKIVDEPTTHPSGTKVLRPFDVHDDGSLKNLNYDILSHRWGGEEVSFQVTNNPTKDELGRQTCWQLQRGPWRRGKWLWIDSCRIGVDAGERQQGINSIRICGTDVPRYVIRTSTTLPITCRETSTVTRGWLSGSSVDGDYRR